MIVLRNFDRSESSDWVLNVQPNLCRLTESIELHDKEGVLLGWKIQGRYE